LARCRIFVKFIGEKAPSGGPSGSINPLVAPLAAASKFKARTLEFRPYTEEVCRALQLWNPEYIGMNTPFISFLMIGSAAINLRVAIDLKQCLPADSDFSGLEVELILLALRQVARFWKIGSILLGMPLSIVTWDLVNIDKISLANYVTIPTHQLRILHETWLSTSAGDLHSDGYCTTSLDAIRLPALHVISRESSPFLKL
jgi:hypothetical protein